MINANSNDPIEFDYYQLSLVTKKEYSRLNCCYAPHSQSAFLTGRWTSIPSRERGVSRKLLVTSFSYVDFTFYCCYGELLFHENDKNVFTSDWPLF